MAAERPLSPQSAPPIGCRVGVGRYSSRPSISLAWGRKEALGDDKRGRTASIGKGVMTGVITEREEGHGKGLLLGRGGVETLTALPSV